MFSNQPKLSKKTKIKLPENTFNSLGEEMEKKTLGEAIQREILHRDNYPTKNGQICLTLTQKTSIMNNNKQLVKEVQ